MLMRRVKGLVATIPDGGMNGEQKRSVENMLKHFSTTNQNRNYDQFWEYLAIKEKQDIIMAVNWALFDRYTPMQIRISIENALKN